MKTFYTATARNMISLYRSNHASIGSENLTESLWYYFEATVKVSDLKDQYTRHEK